MSDPRDYGTRAIKTATIANAASVSDTVDLISTAIVGFVAPAAWTTAAITIEASIDGTNWIASLFDDTNSAISTWSTITAGAGYSVNAVAMLPYRMIRFRSGTSASPVAQGAARSIFVITRPLA